MSGKHPDLPPELQIALDFDLCEQVAACAGVDLRSVLPALLHRRGQKETREKIRTAVLEVTGVSLSPDFGLESEPAGAYLAFAKYRDLPRVGRSLLNAARAARVRVDVAAGWHDQFDWKSRVDAHDVWVDSVLAEDRLAALREHADKARAEHLFLVKDGVTIAGEQLAKLLERSRESESATVSTKDLIRLIEASIKMDRLLHDKPTEIVAPEHIDLEDFDLEELKTFQALMAKATRCAERKASEK